MVNLAHQLTSIIHSKVKSFPSVLALHKQFPFRSDESREKKDARRVLKATEENKNRKLLLA